MENLDLTGLLYGNSINVCDFGAKNAYDAFKEEGLTEENKRISEELASQWDSSDAFIAAINYANENCKDIFIPFGYYVIKEELPRVWVGCTIFSNTINSGSGSFTKTTIVDIRDGSKSNHGFLFDQFSGEYACDHPEYLEIYNRSKNGGGIRNISFIAKSIGTDSVEQVPKPRYCIAIRKAGWDGLIENLKITNYWVAIRSQNEQIPSGTGAEVRKNSSVDDYRIRNCLVVGGGHVDFENMENSNWAIEVLGGTNQHLYENLHVENCALYLKLDAAGQNSFLNCKFEQSAETVYQRIFSEKNYNKIADIFEISDSLTEEETIENYKKRKSLLFSFKPVYIKSNGIMSDRFIGCTFGINSIYVYKDYFYDANKIGIAFESEDFKSIPFFINVDRGLAAPIFSNCAFCSGGSSDLKKADETTISVTGRETRYANFGNSNVNNCSFVRVAYTVPGLEIDSGAIFTNNRLAPVIAAGYNEKYKFLVEMKRNTNAGYVFENNVCNYTLSSTYPITIPALSRFFYSSNKIIGLDKTSGKYRNFYNSGQYAPNAITGTITDEDGKTSTVTKNSLTFIIEPTEEKSVGAITTQSGELFSTKFAGLMSFTFSDLERSTEGKYFNCSKKMAGKISTMINLQTTPPTLIPIDNLTYTYFSNTNKYVRVGINQEKNEIYIHFSNLSAVTFERVIFEELDGLPINIYTANIGEPVVNTVDTNPLEIEVDKYIQWDTTTIS